MLKHLQRKRLVDSKGVATLRDAATALHLETPPPAAPNAPTVAPSAAEIPPETVSVDAVLLRWMGLWGTWSWKEDKDLLMAVVARFQPRSPRRSPAPANGSKPSTPSHSPRMFRGPASP